jgi:hypothetical protein
MTWMIWLTQVSAATGRAGSVMGETGQRWRADVLVCHRGFGTSPTTVDDPTARTRTSAFHLKFQVSRIV